MPSFEETIMEVLTKGAISAVSNGETNLEPCVQVLDLRSIGARQTTQERYRALLSDGTHTQQAMLATQLNDLVRSNQLQKGSIVKLTDFVCNTVQSRRIIIVINLVLVAEKCNTFGEPKPYTDGTANAHAASQARSSMPAQSLSPIGQQGSAAGNPQSHGNSYATGPQVVQTVISGGLKYPKPESVTAYSGSPALTRNVSDPAQNLVRQNQNSSNPGVAGGSIPAINNVSGRPVPPPMYQPPMYVNRGPAAKNDAPARIIPIALLNPYLGRWTIKARVTAKSGLRHYSNAKGQGEVFSFDLLDSDGGEIRVTCFNAVAIQFYDQIEDGKVYLISKGSLKPAQKSFNHLNNEWEITLDSTSTIEPSSEDNSIPRQQFNFRLIGDIEHMENNSMVDLIGIVGSINPSQNMHLRKNGAATQKRTLQLKDISGKSVQLTLWGDFCNSEGQQLQDMCDSGVFPVLAVKASRVNDFNGKSVGTISTSQLFVNPDFPEAHELMEWFHREGQNIVPQSISKDTLGMGHTDVRKIVSQISDEGLGRSERPDWITVKAVISSIKSANLFYAACPLMVGDRKCNKKVNNNDGGRWHCERCDQSFPECDYRYNIQFSIQDHTCSTWVTAFQEAGEEIMGTPAKDLYLLRQEEQDGITRRACFTQYLFKLRVKEELYNDEHRVKSIVVKAERVNFATESKYIAGLIEKLSGRDSNVFTGSVANTGSDSGYYHGNFTNGVISNGRNPVGNNSVNIINRYGMPSVSQSGQYMNGSCGSGAGPTKLNGRDASVCGAPDRSNKCNQVGHWVIDIPLSGAIPCHNCGGAGHNPQNCPRGSNGQPVGGFSNRFPTIGAAVVSASDRCYKCNQGGHLAGDCPGSVAIPSTYGNSGATGRFGTSSSSYGGDS